MYWFYYHFLFIKVYAPLVVKKIFRFYTLKVVSDNKLDITCTLEGSNFLLLKKKIIQNYGKKEFYAKPVVNGIDFVFRCT